MIMVPQDNRIKKGLIIWLHRKEKVVIPQGSFSTASGIHLLSEGFIGQGECRGQREPPGRNPYAVSGSPIQPFGDDGSVIDANRIFKSLSFPRVPSGIHCINP